MFIGCKGNIYFTDDSGPPSIFIKNEQNKIITTFDNFEGTIYVPLLSDYIALNENWRNLPDNIMNRIQTLNIKTPFITQLKENNEYINVTNGNENDYLFTVVIISPFDPYFMVGDQGQVTPHYFDDNLQFELYVKGVLPLSYFIIFLPGIQ